MTDEGHMDRELSRRVGDAAVVQRVFDELPLLAFATQGPEHRFVAATGAYRAYTDRSNLIGTLVRDAFPEILSQQIIPILDGVFSSGAPSHPREFRAWMDLPEVGATIEIVIDVNVRPRRDRDGRIVGLSVDMVDVTERVRERQAAQRQTAAAERRYERARDVIDALQRELLPTGLPGLPRVQLAASYLLADGDTAAGGDWFDAVCMPDGRVALVVGDVVGHGVTASATMGQLRILLREYLTTDPDLLAALTALDAAAGRVRGAQAATVCVVALDATTGGLEYCAAGHPAPLVVPTSGPARYLAPTAAGPLGVGGGLSAESIGRDRLAESELVLLYTDGILERPGREHARSTVELAQAVTDIAAGRALPDNGVPVERVAIQTLELLTRVTGHTDDITLLVAQRVDPPSELDALFPATTTSLAEVREQINAWLADAYVGERDAALLRHAVLELATNAVEHAYLDLPVDESSGHAFTVRAVLSEAGTAELRVADQGRWREPAPSPDRGLGLHLAENLVDRLRIEHDEQGTTVFVSHRIERPACLLTSADAPWGTAPRPEASDFLIVLDQPSAPRPRIRVDGPVDAASVDEFERAVRMAGSTGARSLTVDLTGVSHLASAGVSAVHRLIALHGDNGTALRWYAPTGSPADVIMSLVRVEHDTADPDQPAA